MRSLGMFWSSLAISWNYFSRTDNCWKSCTRSWNPVASSLYQAFSLAASEHCRRRRTEDKLHWTSVILSRSHCIMEAETRSSFCVYTSLSFFSGRASSWLGRRFVCKECLGSALGQSSVKYPMSTAQLFSCSRSLWHSSSLVCPLEELVALFPYAGAERFTSFLRIQDSLLLFVQGMSNMASYPSVVIDSWPLVHLELYSFGRTLSLFFWLLRAGGSHLVHGPGRHSMFFRPGHDLRSSFLPEWAVSEKRFIAVLGEVHLHCWSFIVVRHGGMCTGMSFVFCSSDLPSLIPSRTCSSLPLMSHLIQYPGYHWDMIPLRCVADEHPLFQVSVFQGLFDWDPLYERFVCLCGLSYLFCFQVLVWHHCRQVFTSCSASHSRPCRFSLLDVLAWWRRQLHVVSAI